MSLEYRDESAAAETEPEYAPPDFEFPTPVYTYILLACISAVMLAQLYAGLQRSIGIAGFVKPAFLFDHEYWLILTGGLRLHGSFLHVFMNGYALHSFGRLMESLTNRAHVATVFLLSAIGGGLLSVFFYPEGTSVGASGGIVGLIGYLAVYAFRRRRFVSPEFRKSLLINIAFILVFGLVLFQIVDNYADFGGLLTGVGYAFIQVPSDEYRDPRDASTAAKAIGFASLAIYGGASAFAIYLLLSTH